MIKSLLSLYLVCSICGQLYSAEGQKWALLVGIDTYRNLADLGGAANDVTDMKDLLIKKMGFPEDNVVVLVNEKATRAAILQAMEQDLIQRAGKHDTAVFYFSGHGSQMVDTSGDEPDGRDETLVPHDSRDEGIFDISDDQIHTLLTRLTQRCRNVTFIFDSCHSGSGQRAGPWRKVPMDQRKPPASRSGLAGRSVGFGKLEAENYVMISACRANQVAGEIDINLHKRGALTYHLAKRLRQADASTTWRDVITDVGFKVETWFKDQKPQLHGDGDRIVFGLDGMSRETHFLVTPHQDRVVKVDGGEIHSLTEGSTFDVYPNARSRRDKKQPLFAIRITEVGHFTSLARIIDGEPPKKTLLAFAREPRSMKQNRLSILALKGSEKAVGSVALKIGRNGETLPESADVPVFQVGDDLYVQVSNGSRRNIYLTVLALYANGKIDCLYPGPGEVQQPIVFNGYWWDEFALEIPPQEIILKCFITYKPVDLSYLYLGGTRAPARRPARWGVLEQTIQIR